MIILSADTKKQLSDFYNVGSLPYRNNSCYRGTEDDIVRLLTKGKSHFHNHASSSPFVIYLNNIAVGRFLLIHDQRMPGVVQIAFFEVLKDINPINKIIDIIKVNYSSCFKIIAGLNGHLNYGAGFLLNRYNEVPVFGLGYNPPYYAEIFSEFSINKAVSFRFPAINLENKFEKWETRIKNRGISVRTINKKQFKQEIARYTLLNNMAFQNHPYWTNRDVEEDWELYYPFRFLLREENVLIAEFQSRPVGFLLWFPDFNQLINNSRALRASCYCGTDVIKYKLINPINTFRLAEIAVIPEFQKRGVELLLMFEMMRKVRKRGFSQGEGGFIFEENKSSLNLAQRYIERITEQKVEPYREYAVYEKEF